MPTKKEIEERIAELKMDYIRIQGDMEKLETTGRTVRPLERELKAIEDELKTLRNQL
ncbi:SE1832 family protein [Pullulanibacillus sp. KACC 23026]|uniref:SE1832 family protein n=1 Tax=Pullulanibacillus sp. KACC 23026 TaxID=3028315 RepID=UPI0023B10BFC|nr:SE1832 family protein [Pullulanibacillus sp. KACC 23026]WEG11835.1 SE1832 family protein [Pullulanibacillus sp. KACC 23026]